MGSLRPVSIPTIRQLSDYDYASTCITILAKERRLDLVRLVRPLAGLRPTLPAQTSLDRIAWLDSYLLDKGCGHLWSRLVSLASEDDVSHGTGVEAVALGAKIHLHL